MVASLLLALACWADGAADSTSIPTLIERLASPRFAEREAASVALTDLGIDALNQLRVARRTSDAEVQNRIEGVIDRIERERLHTPTFVQLAAKPRPVGLLINDVESQLGFPLRREPGPASDWLKRRVEWTTDDPVPFWDALDRLGIDGTWTIDRDPSPFRTRPLAEFNVSQRLPNASISIDGPFRFALREARTVPAPKLPRPFAGGNTPRLDPTRAAPGLVDLTIDLSCEPRLGVRPRGEARLTQALDANGRNLLPGGKDVPLNITDSDGSYGPTLGFTAEVAAPARGTQIATLRGKVPVEVETRRLDPIEIPIQPAANANNSSPVWCGDVTFVACYMADTAFDTPMVELVIQPEGWSQMSLMMFRGRFRRNNFAQQLNDMITRVTSNVNIVDAEGNILENADARQNLPPRPMPDGLHIMIPVTVAPKAGAPHRVQYHGTLREPLDLEFALQNISVPAANAR